jgi:hypothetical protein
MRVVTLRLPEDQHQRLRAMAQARGLTLLDKLERADNGH